MQDLEHVFSYIISSQELDKSSIDLAQVISENGIQTTRMDCMNVLSADGRNDKNNLRKNFENKFSRLKYKNTKIRP